MQASGLGGGSSRRKSATPYELLTTQGGASSSSASPFRTQRQSLFNSDTPVRGYGGSPAGSVAASRRSLDGDTGSPFRRNVPFGSPGLRALGKSPGVARSPNTAAAGTPESSSANKPRVSKRFIRKKPWSEKLADLPFELVDRLSLQVSEYAHDLQDLPSNAGIVFGLIMHLLSILVHFISPDSELGVLPSWGGSSSAGKTSGLFRDGGAARGLNLQGAAGGASAAEKMRRISSARREAWLRGMSILLSFALLSLASYNAYSLFFRSRRRYTLLMRGSDEKIRSENAKLIPVQEEEDGEPISARILAFMLGQARKVPVVRWFIPSDLAAWRAGRSEVPQMHAVDVWQAPPFYLAVFCVYSPVHALWYHFAALLGVKGIIAWIATWLVMAGIGAQMLFTVQQFQALQQDRQLIAGEVMNEYEKKFVFPSAMPEMRDASTSTNEAEMVGYEGAGFFARRTTSVPSGLDRNSLAPPESTPRKKGRKTAG